MTSVPEQTVLVVDDDPSVRRSLARLMRSAGYSCMAFSGPAEFLAEDPLPDVACIILDVSMPDVDGLELQAALEARGEEIPIIFLTGHGDVPTSVAAMKLGAHDFLLKPVQDAILLQAVEGALERARSLVARRRRHARVRQCWASLTPREQEVFVHVVAGKLNKQVAADLGTVEKTIKVHRARVMHKMQAASLADLVRIAGLLGIHDADPAASAL